MELFLHIYTDFSSSISPHIMMTVKAYMSSDSCSSVSVVIRKLIMHVFSSDTIM